MRLLPLSHSQGYVHQRSEGTAHELFSPYAEERMDVDDRDASPSTRPALWLVDVYEPEARLRHVSRLELSMKHTPENSPLFRPHSPNLTFRQQFESTPVRFSFCRSMLLAVLYDNHRPCMILVTAVERCTTLRSDHSDAALSIILLRRASMGGPHQSSFNC